MTESQHQSGVIVGDCREVLESLPAGHYHTCVTSPPYFGLRSYLDDDDPDKPREIGSEATADEFVAAMRSVFGGKDNPVGCWRVLRGDGVCWLNLGDGYAGSCAPSAQGDYRPPASRKREGLNPKDLMGIPWRVAIALQADGWHWRQTNYWTKTSPMPESVRDRTTTAVEPVFMMAKQPRYYYDNMAVRTTPAAATVARMRQDIDSQDGSQRAHGGKKTGGAMKAVGDVELGGNLRNWWADISPANFRAGHFATMPPDLAVRCIKFGTSEKGCCPDCGAPWERIVERDRQPTRPGRDNVSDASGMANRDEQRHVTSTRTTGWEPGCDCGQEPVPCRVLDMFGGAGTTAVAAKALGRDYTMIELSEEYAEMARRRIAHPIAQGTDKQYVSLPGQQSLFN